MSSFTNPPHFTPSLVHGSNDAVHAVVSAWEKFKNTSNPVDAAEALVALDNAIGDLASWHPHYDAHTHTIRFHDDQDDTDDE